LSFIPWPKAKVGDFISSDRKWNIDLLKDLLTDHPIIHRIVGIPLSLSEVTDSVCWGITILGVFSMKSVTWLAHGCSSEVDGS